mgnify:CR=1 FL=1
MAKSVVIGMKRDKFDSDDDDSSSESPTGISNSDSYVKNYKFTMITINPNDFK